MSTAGLIIIGDEILSAKVVDTNGPFLTRELRSLGVSVQRIITIPDQTLEIANAVREFSDRFDFVFTSGGIGPTHDDVTLPSVALAFETTLYRPHELIKRLRTHSLENPMPLTAHSFRLIEVPVGTELLQTEPDLWPVYCMKNVYILPGVPELFRRKFLAIRKRFLDIPFFGQEIYVKVYEEQIAPQLDHIVKKYPEVNIGSYPRYQAAEDGHRVKITVEGKDPAAVERVSTELIRNLAQTVVGHRAIGPLNGT